jgi:hypothetical protein
MRIILFPATVLGATAMAAAAAAQPAPNGHVKYPAGVTTAAEAGQVYGGRPHWRPGPGMHRGRGRDGHGPGLGGGVGFPYLFAPYGIEGDYEAVDPHGTGFFAGAGGRVRLSGGRPYYDYDRAYPYEWASAAGGGRPGAGGEPVGWSVAATRCAVEKGVRVCRGGE